MTTATDDAPFLLTWFPDRLGCEAKRVVTTWPRFVDGLRRIAPQPEKDRSPLVKLATFGIERTPAGSLRHDANLRRVTGIEVEHDAGKVSPIEALGRLERHHLRAAVVTTWSYEPEHPRWRAYLPFAEPAEPAGRQRFVAAVNGALGGIVAPESFKLSQSFYVGGRPGGEYLVLATFDDPREGFCVDEWDRGDELAIYPEGGPVGSHQRPPAAPIKERIPEGARETTLASIAGTLRRRGLDEEEIMACLVAVNERRCEPKLRERDVRRIAHSIARKPAGETVVRATA